jgi:hypothetical protein
MRFGIIASEALTRLDAEVELGQLIGKMLIRKLGSDAAVLGLLVVEVLLAIIVILIVVARLRGRIAGRSVARRRPLGLARQLGKGVAGRCRHLLLASRDFLPVGTLHPGWRPGRDRQFRLDLRWRRRPSGLRTRCRLGRATSGLGVGLPDQPRQLGKRIGLSARISTATEAIGGKGSVLVTISHLMKRPCG